MKKRISSIIKYPLIVIFGAAIFVMFVLYLTVPQKAFSDVENRTLQLMPTPSLSSLADGSYMSKFETYTTEQLPFREGFVRIKALIKQITLSNENNGIVKGNDGYLFETTYGISAQYGKNVAALKKFTSDVGRPVYIAIAPTAPEILKRKAPEGFRTINQKQELDTLKSKLQNSSSNGADIRWIDLYETMDSRSALGEQMYYRTDHHWTSLAAYYAYRDIVSALSEGTDSYAVRPVAELETLKASEANDFYGTHYAKFREYNIEPDTLTYYDIPIKRLIRSDGEYDSLYDFDKLKIYDKYAMFMRGNDDVLMVESDNAEGDEERRLILFKDSYANCLIPFLTYQYDKITVVDLRYYSESVSALLEKDETADIMLLYNFDFINEDNHFYRLTT